MRGISPTPRLVVLLSTLMLAAVALIFSKKPAAESMDAANALWGADAHAELDQATIFVSVASYRDEDCSGTLRSMYENAAVPRRIFAGVCQQNKEGETAEECVDPSLPWRQNVRVITMPHTEAKGPTFARFRCASLYKGETYFCQIDSHTTFLKGWDRTVIADLRRCPSPKPVISYYPHDSRANATDKDASTVPVLCKSKFDKGSGVVTFEAVSMPAAKDAPRSIPFVAGGFFFGPGSIPVEVPFDPTLDHLFNGEEIAYSARLWTHGYDFFAPLHNYVYHYYGRKDRPKYWTDISGYASAQKTSQQRVVRLLGLDAKPPATGQPFGLGNARSLQAYLDFAGLNPADKTTASQKKFCA